MAESWTKPDDIVEDEDDGVIFKGSPLYASLVQSGSLAEELEIQQTGLKTTAVIDTNQKSELKYKRFSRWPSVIKLWSTLCKKLKTWFLPDLSHIYHKHHLTVINDLSASCCLEDDDQDFVQFYIQNSCNTENIHTASSGICQLAFDIVALLVAVSAYRYVNWNVAKNPFPWRSVTLSTVLPAVVLFAFKEGRCYRHRRKCKKVSLSYNDFLKKNEIIAGMVKKCLRLIQETELISRGFTLVSQRNPLSRLEGTQKDTVTRQCPVLRKLVFTVAREAVLVFREMTKQIFDLHPLSTELDIQGTYLAYEPIQSYGPCLQIGTEDAEHLHTITDGFSISALKGVSHLFSLHQSEFIKALVLVQQERFEKGKNFYESEELNILESVSTRLEEWTASLQKSHDYHSCAWMNKEPVSREPRTQSDIDDIYVAVHSLDLHLQAALTRVKCLSELIQSSSDIGKTDVQVDDLLNHMQPIRAELESSKGCWEEGINRIEKAAGKSSSGEQDISVKESDSGIEETPNTEVPLRKIEDYIIEDQVFEGYTDSNEIVADYEWDRPLTAAEKEKKRREKEEALRMLSELKTVISVRAVETEKREKAAMLKMYPGLSLGRNPTSQPVETLCDMELTKKEVTKISSSHGCQEVEKADSLCSDKQGEVSCSYKQVDTIPCVGDGLTHDFSDIEDADKITGEADEDRDKYLETSQKYYKSTESWNKGNKYSVISSQGVHRLRKSNMLDLSDSDLEDYPDDEDDTEQLDADNEEEMPRLCLPLRKLIEDDAVEDDSEGVSDEIIKFRLPMLTLQERLENFSGANFGITSEIAEKAVARSKEMGLGEETTFGGDVYGECSSGSDDDDDHDIENDYDKSENNCINDESDCNIDENNCDGDEIDCDDDK